MWGECIRYDGSYRRPNKHESRLTNSSVAWSPSTVAKPDSYAIETYASRFPSSLHSHRGSGAATLRQNNSVKVCLSSGPKTLILSMMGGRECFQREQCELMKTTQFGVERNIGASQQRRRMQSPVCAPDCAGFAGRTSYGHR